MRRLILLTMLIIIALSANITFAQIDPVLESMLTPEEKNWLLEHGNDHLFIGLDPLAGMEYFISDETDKGYLKTIATFLSEKTTLNLSIKPDLSWGEAVSALESGKIQILFGANPTPERLKTMDFTDPIYSVPYTVLSHENGVVQNIGDLNEKNVGFLEGDIVINILKDAYTNLKYNVVTFDDQQAGLHALSTKTIDAFITSGGDVVYDYLFKYPELKVVVNFEEIRSLMTFSALKSQSTLVSILSKSLSLYESELDLMIDDARNQYIRKILRLTPIEKNWLKHHSSIRVGVPTDYLPIDHYENGQYKGIAGHYMTAFADLIGLEIIAVPGSFDDVYDMVNRGEVDVLNMAKTDDRLNKFVFTDAFSNERDQIYGHRDSKYVHDIYGLEGKKVAVIKGFWHIDHLKLNLQNPELVIVSDIKEAIEAVVKGDADYFIETPAVAEFYISGLGYTNIIKKGETSSDSFLYFGMLKEHAPLASIFNRAKMLIRYENSKYLGVQGLPEIDNVANRRLLAIILGISGIVGILLIISLKLQRDLILTKEKERLIYIDPLTGIHNRNYFNLIEASVDQKLFPQTIFVLDINQLKQINDQYGHLNGDRLIDLISKIIMNTAKIFDGTAFRMGGDEFVLIFFGLTAEKINLICNSLKDTFSATPLYDDSDTIILDSLKVAIGHSSRSSHEKRFDQCFKEADQAMYDDKRKENRRKDDKI